MDPCPALDLCLFYVLAKLGQEKGLGHAILGFLLPVYPYVWGWMQGRRLERLDIKGFWTVITVFSMIFPAVITAATVSAFSLPYREEGPSATRGSILGVAGISAATERARAPASA